VIEAEPALAIVLSADRFDAALLAVGSFADLKSPFFLGHSRAVADLAGRAGARLGLTEAQVQMLRRGGLVHDLGRLGVSNSIWDKRGPLGTGEWERVRFHPYLTERMLQQSQALAPLAAIAVQHRERLERHEVDRVAVHVLVAVLDHPVVVDVRGAFLRDLRHRSPHSAGVTPSYGRRRSPAWGVRPIFGMPRSTEADGDRARCALHGLRSCGADHAPGPDERDRRDDRAGPARGRISDAASAPGPPRLGRPRLERHLRPGRAGGATSSTAGQVDQPLPYGST
jgi:hypothetical protein